MTVQVSYPGVYIDEFAPGAPIQGVSTSTGAFLGPASDGPLNLPTLVTSWDQFTRTFGTLPLPGLYLWYAVRGFFENGGTTCYVTRVSNATFAQLDLYDRSGSGGNKTISVRARVPGATPSLSVTVDGDVHAVAKAGLFRPKATLANASGTSITVTDAGDAAQFRPGDGLTWNGSAESQPVIVSRIEAKVIRLAQPLTGTYSAGTVRLADLQAGDTTFRVQNASKLGSGSVVKLSQTKPAATDTQVVQQVIVEHVTTALTTYRVTLRSGLAVGFSLDPSTGDATLESEEFTLTVSQAGTSRPPYTELGMDPQHPNYFRRVINQDPNGLIFAAPVEPPNTTLPPDNRPRTLATTPLPPGTADNPAALAPSDYISALARLEPQPDVSMVAIPDRTDLQVQLAIVDHCTRLFNRFAILDSRRDAPLFGTDSVEVQRNGLDTANGFAALYYPWLLVAPATGSDPVLVPPSGHMAGIYARTDDTRGVHKAPAGEEALVSGAFGIGQAMSDIDQGVLNLEGINVIRIFKPGGRPVVWGARTTSTVTTWRYVNIRRLFIFLERSILEGIRWAVFEPNNLQLWQKVKRTITDFLTRAWRDGALFGAKAEDAFYVRIDDVLNPFSEQQLGRLNIEIGVRPAYPAEFIIVHIGIWAGGTQVSD